MARLQRFVGDRVKKTIENRPCPVCDDGHLSLVDAPATIRFGGHDSSDSFEYDVVVVRCYRCGVLQFMDPRPYVPDAIPVAASED